MEQAHLPDKSPLSLWVRSWGERDPQKVAVEFVLSEKAVGDFGELNA